MAFTFTGGLDLQRSGRASLNRIIALPTPAFTVFDFSGDKNTVFTPFLSQNDPVSVYQCIGEQTAGEDKIPVYSGIAGSVRSILKNADGIPVGMVITSSEEQKKAEIKGYEGTLADLDPQKIVETVKNSAIPCRGSHGFAYKRLLASQGKTKRFILNFCESEPGVSSRKALITEDIDAVLNGAKLLMRAVDIRTCDIAIERDNGQMIGLLTEKIRKNRLFSVRKTKHKYPQDEEVALIFALNGTQLSDAESPERSGCVVFDAETAAAVYRAVVYGVPYCERVVTVDTENLLCPIGTPVSELLDFCDIRPETAVKIISGGPLRGKTFKKLDEPVKADTSAITVIYAGEGRPIPQMTQCTRCGKCVSVCPSRIMPFRIAELSKQKRYAKCAEFGANACCECGCCDYVCPAYIPIKKLIRTAKHKKVMPKRDKNETEPEIEPEESV
ncbi:MAG: hypothetical protein IJT49_03915 [Clostridia bacterium]|nr:hypothetical protein [Clostridia bacterium]